MILFLLGVSVPVGLCAQTVSGFVYDKVSKEPLVGASVYFDNTTIGTSTDLDGSFELTLPEGIRSSMVISFIGYSTETRSQFDRPGTLSIFLEPESNVLEEVVLSPDDDWPRDLKLSEFKKNYLGSSLRGRSCVILNEDDLILVYSKKRKRLYARIKAPLLIKNEKLKYLITADLKAFGLGYASVSKNRKKLVSSGVVYKGLNRYENLDSVGLPSVEQARQDAYYGSVLHFMRSLARRELYSQGYTIRYQGKVVDPDDMITVVERKSGESVMVRLKDRIEILYKTKDLSAMEVSAPVFYIDSQGNHSPIDKVRFGGEMGEQRMGDALPMDYLIQDKLQR